MILQENVLLNDKQENEQTTKKRLATEVVVLTPADPSPSARPAKARLKERKQKLMKAIVYK